LFYDESEAYLKSGALWISAGLPAVCKHDAAHLIAKGHGTVHERRIQMDSRFLNKRDGYKQRRHNVRL
jgi:hypothetical protein